MRYKDHTGERVGLLTYLEFSHSDKGRPFWKVRCDCGEEKIIRWGNAKSCGCLRSKYNRIRSLGKGSKKTAETLIELSARDIYRRVYSDGDLEFQTFLEMTQEECHYCGAKPSNQYSICFNKDGSTKSSARKNSEGKSYQQMHWALSNYSEGPVYFKYNGLDRIDQEKPHDLENLVPCCWICNKMKTDMSREVFETHLQRIFEWKNITKR